MRSTTKEQMEILLRKGNSVAIHDLSDEGRDTCSIGHLGGLKNTIEYVEKALDGGKTPRHNVLLVQF
jgi:hypothetical protein